MEAVPDALAGEQTWPSEEEIQHHVRVDANEEDVDASNRAAGRSRRNVPKNVRRRRCDWR